MLDSILAGIFEKKGARPHPRKKASHIGAWTENCHVVTYKWMQLLSLIFIAIFLLILLQAFMHKFCGNSDTKNAYERARVCVCVVLAVCFILHCWLSVCSVWHSELGMVIWICGNNEIWCAINFWISATCCRWWWWWRRGWCWCWCHEQHKHLVRIAEKSWLRQQNYGRENN